MNRKASLEWSLETIGKLILFVIMLVALLYISYQLVSLFISKNDDYTARRNFENLIERIELARKLNEPSVTTIMYLPGGYAVLSYSKNVETVSFTETSITTSGDPDPRPTSETITVKRPGRLEGCSGDSCICLYSYKKVQIGGGVANTLQDPIECKSFDVAQLQGRMDIPQGIKENKPLVVKADISSQLIKIDFGKYNTAQPAPTTTTAQTPKPSAFG
jgi:hypothetical protein